MILFRRLAVFVGGWTLEAAEAICVVQEDLDVLLTLEALIDHHLIIHIQDRSKGSPRFIMLETIREYALERFAESDEAESIRKRHAQFFIDFANESNAHLNTTPIEEHVLWKERLTLEMENLRAALIWAIANAEEWRQTAVHLYETLGDLLELTGQHEEARKVYQETLQEIAAHDVIWPARLYRRIGKTWEYQGNFPEALRAYLAAERMLEGDLNQRHPRQWQEWVEIQVDRIWMCYWQNTLDEMAALIHKAQPIVERYGTQTQKTRFFHGLTLLGYKQDRYMLSEKTEAYALSAVSASHGSKNLNVINMSQFHLGFSYLWADKLDEAEKPLCTALKLAEQIGDVVLQSRCLTSLTILYRRRNQREQVKSHIPRCVNAANMAQLPEYIGTANANLAWVAWSEESLSNALKHGSKALEIWRQLSFSYPMQWVALWPLIGVSLIQKRTSDALKHVRLLLDPGQKRLPEKLTAALEQAIQDWEAGEQKRSRGQLSQAMQLAQELRHF